MEYRDCKPMGRFRSSMLLAMGIPCLLAMPVAMGDDGYNAPVLSYLKQENGVKILIDGELFTQYLCQSGTRPVLWPLIGPTGQPMTRAYPVSDAAKGEKRDHIHHRSMWIGYEGLNGTDFWHEPEMGTSRPYPVGTVQHREFTTVQSKDNMVVVVTENDWLDEGKQRVCSDTRRLQFGCKQDFRWIDCVLEIQASDGPVSIADSKEGFFAVRVASPIRVDADNGGKIVSSTGRINTEAWSLRADWVDYHGSLFGETVGIAILCHPDSYIPRPRWHVRTYGLFAANPFGEQAFTDPDSKVTLRKQRLELAEGSSLVFGYRVLLHRGDERDARIDKEFRKYASKELVATTAEKREKGGHSTLRY